MGRWIVSLALALLLAGIAAPALAQKPAPSTDKSKGQPLSFSTASLPSTVPQVGFQTWLQADGGTHPLKWSVKGDLPPGLVLEPGSGWLHGTTLSAGDFDLTFSVTDSSTPPQTVTRTLVLRVLPALELVWKQQPGLKADQIEGAVDVSNNSPDEFDLTVIVVAVNEVGKAFALGYQHGPMLARSKLNDVAFGEQMNLPRGRYVVHVDAVAEVPARKAIYRARLQAGTLQVP